MIETKNNIDAYKFYKLLEDPLKTPVKLATYRAITNGFAKFIMKKVFEGFDVKLSTGNTLGVLCIRGKKAKIKITEDGNIKGLCPDWKATKKAWEDNPTLKEKKQLVYHLNEHSDGIRYKFTWLKANAKLTNKAYYSFVASRKNKRTLPQEIKKGKEYLVLQRKDNYGIKP